MTLIMFILHPFIRSISSHKISAVFRIATKRNRQCRCRCKSKNVWGRGNKINQEPAASCLFYPLDIVMRRKFLMRKNVKKHKYRNHSCKQFDIQSYGTHEEVDVCQSLARHCGRKGFRKSNSFHDTVLDCHDESLLLLGACTNTDCSEELPDVNIFAGIDCTGEDSWKGGFKNIEESIVSGDPVAR